MSWVLSCKTKDRELKPRLEQYARANGLSKSKVIEELLNETLQNKDNNEFTAGILREKRAVDSLLCLLAEMEVKTKELKLILNKTFKNEKNQKEGKVLKMPKK